VATALPAGGTVDAVAVLAGADPPAARVAAALAPGGVVYWENDRRRPGCRRRTPARVAAALAAAGLAPAGRFAVRPGLARPELYLPVDEPGPFRWYASSVYVAARPVQRLGEAAVRAVTGLDGRRLAAIAPFHAVVAVHGERPGPAVAERAAGATGPVALVNHGGNRVVLFAFEGAAPATVVKVPEQPAFAARTVREQEVMREVRAALGPAADAVPEPAGLADVGLGVPAAVEAGAPGRTMARSSGRWGRPLARRVEDLTAAAAWLERLHVDARVADGRWDAHARRTWLDGPVARFAERFGTTAAEDRLFAATAARAAALDGAPLPVVWQHGDYTVWNLVRDRDRLRVLDWEGARPGLPLCDLDRFATHWHELATGARTERDRQAALAALFLDPDAGARAPATAAARDALDRHRRAVGVPAGLAPVLLVAAWVELCVRRSDQQRDGGAAPAGARAGNPNLPYLATLAGGCGRLFPEVSR
jgi:aminoglycoside phosphotransferase (APT) family kinase protein